MTATTTTTTTIVTLQIAKQLIIQRQYREAATVLATIRGNATADQWLSKLEAGMAQLAGAGYAPKPNDAYQTDADFPTDADMAPLRDLPTFAASNRKSGMLQSLAAMLW